jgi:hypothetical protein
MTLCLAEEKTLIFCFMGRFSKKIDWEEFWNIFKTYLNFFYQKMNENR